MIAKLSLVLGRWPGDHDVMAATHTPHASHTGPSFGLSFLRRGSAPFSRRERVTVRRLQQVGHDIFGGAGSHTSLSAAVDAVDPRHTVPGLHR